MNIKKIIREELDWEWTQFNPIEPREEGDIRVGDVYTIYDDASYVFEIIKITHDRVFYEILVVGDDEDFDGIEVGDVASTGLSGTKRLVLDGIWKLTDYYGKGFIKESEGDGLDWIRNIPDDVVGKENYKKYISGKPFKLRPEDIEVVGYNIEGKPIRKYVHREWDEIVPPEQVDRTSFTLQSHQVKYEIGDVIVLKNNDVIKKVTITDVIEIPFRSFGSGFVPHMFKYKFV